MTLIETRIVWGVFTLANILLTFYLIWRIRDLEKDYEERRVALQGEVDRIQARNDEYLQAEKDKVDAMGEYWREELRKLGIPDPS